MAVTRFALSAGMVVALQLGFSRPANAQDGQDAIVVDQAVIQLAAPIALAEPAAPEPAVEAAAVVEEHAAEAAQDEAAAEEGAAAEVKAVRVQAAIAVRAQVQALDLQRPDADEDAQLAPYLAQFRPILKTELSFAHRVCQFTDEQKAQAIEQGKAKLQEFARAYLKGQNQPQQGIVFFGALAAPQAQITNPRGSLEDDVAKLVKEIVNDDQRLKYEAELAQRNEFRRQAALENVLSMVDAKLLLAPEQRQQIAESLQKNWDDGWAPALDALVHMGEYLPQIPDERVVVHLNDEQKSVWQGIQKVNYGSFFGDSNWIDGGQQMNDFDLGE